MLPLRSGSAASIGRAPLWQNLVSDERRWVCKHRRSVPRGFVIVTNLTQAVRLSALPFDFAEQIGQIRYGLADFC
jgi:hypothetical protein